MITLPELKKLAMAATTHKGWLEFKHNVSPATVLKMVELIEMQHEALKGIVEVTCVNHRDGESTIIACDIPRAAQEAIAAFDAFNKEDE